MSLQLPRRGSTLGACSIALFFLLSLVASGRHPATTAEAASQASGLVAAYAFDETTGTTASDASGTGNAGTVTGAVWTTGHTGGALSFDGTSDYVTVADGPSVDLSSGMTAEAWVYPTSTAGTGAVIAKERTGGGLPYGLESTAGVPDGYVNATTPGAAAATASLALNGWTHLATTYDGTTLRLYVNGALAGSTPVSGTLVNSSDPLRIGADLTWGEYFQGKIDDVRVYNRALTATEVQTDMNTAVRPPAPPPPASGLVAGYGFEAGSGTTAADASGNGRTGTITGATWSTAGKFGNALSFDGTSDYVTVPDSAALDFTNALTLEAWVYPTSSAGWQTVIAKERAGGGFPYGLEVAAGTADGYGSNGGSATAAAASALPLNTWTHLACTYDGTTLRLYVNGALASSQALPSPLIASADPLRIGADLTWGEYFQGRIDEVRVYNKALAATAIQTDMNTAVAGGAPPPPPPAPDTTPPSIPGGLTVGTKTQTSIALSWNASTDNVGVTGYGVYNGATRLQQVSSTSATVTGLACGTTYTLGVDAYDAAGNRSAKSTAAASTTACPPPTGASVYLSPSGSDSNPCTQSAPCFSFDRGYQVAQPGQVVQAAAGSYGGQDILFDPSKTSNDVVIQPAPGASVTIGQLDIGSTRMEAGASHLTIKDITVTGDVSIPGCGVPDGTACPPDSSSPGNDLTFQNLRVKGPYAFYCASCSNVSLIGGTWGPDTYQCRGGFGSAHPEVQSAYTQVKRAHGILIDGVNWQNFARCSGSDHTECLQVEPADDMTVRNSTFRNCDTIVVNFANDLANSNSAAGYRAPNNILIENNFFDTAKDNTGGPTYYALNIRECTNCTVRYNSWTQAPRMPTGEVSINNKFIGNVGPMPSSNCGINGVTYSHNVWEGASCSSTDKNVSNVGFVNRGAVDLHLAAGSPAIDSGDPGTYPAKDIDARARPLGAAPDAGASERQ